MLLVLLDFLYRYSSHCKQRNKGTFISYFPIYMFLLHFFVFCIRTSGTMLKIRDKRGHFCLVPDLTGKASSFSLLSLIITGIFVDIFCQLEEVPLYSQITEAFYHEWVWDFVRCFFFLHLLIWSCDFLFFS